MDGVQAASSTRDSSNSSASLATVILIPFPARVLALAPPFIPSQTPSPARILALAPPCHGHGKDVHVVWEVLKRLPQGHEVDGALGHVHAAFGELEWCWNGGGCARGGWARTHRRHYTHLASQSKPPALRAARTPLSNHPRPHTTHLGEGRYEVVKVLDLSFARLVKLEPNLTRRVTHHHFAAPAATRPLLARHHGSASTARCAPPSSTTTDTPASTSSSSSATPTPVVEMVRKALASRTLPGRLMGVAVGRSLPGRLGCGLGRRAHTHVHPHPSLLALRVVVAVDPSAAVVATRAACLDFVHVVDRAKAALARTFG